MIQKGKIENWNVKCPIYDENSDDCEGCIHVLPHVKTWMCKVEYCGHTRAEKLSESCACVEDEYRPLSDAEPVRANSNKAGG